MMPPDAMPPPPGPGMRADGGTVAKKGGGAITKMGVKKMGPPGFKKMQGAPAMGGMPKPPSAPGAMDDLKFKKGGKAKC